MPSTPSDGAAKSGSGAGRTTVVAALVLGVVAISGLGIAFVSGRSLSIKVGDQSLELGANPEMGAVLDAAMAARPDDFEALLAARGYYRVTSAGLVDALARIDEAKEDGAAVTTGVRRLLWNLDGPFSGDGVLSEADVRFLSALEDVDRQAAKEPGGAVIIELWQRSLERRSPMPLRLFSARVVPVRGGDAAAGAVYFCPSSDGRIDGKHVSLFRTDSNAMLEGTLVADDRRRLDCPSEAVTIRDLFAGAPMTLGIDPDRFAEFAGPDGAPDGGVSASFEVQPSRPLAAAATQ